MLVDSLWRSQGIKCIVAIHEGQAKQFFLDDASKAQAVVQRLDAAGADVYFSPSLYTGRRRNQAAVLGVGAFWLDLDVGEGKPYADWRGALQALTRWIAEVGFHKPSSIVHSGYGLHVYWFLDAAYPGDQWQVVARHFKQALAVAGVHADPARTADSASILRFPGTRNFKDPENPQPVREVFSGDQRFSLEEFQARLPSVGPMGSVPPTRPTNSEWDVPDNYPLGDAEAISQMCAQMGNYRAQQGAVAEPYWRAGLSVIMRCADGDKLIHDWSRGDPRYDERETQDKADRTGGPATCSHFSEVNPGGCAACPHQGTVTSPVQLALAGATAAPTPERTARPKDEDWRPTEVNRFQITNAGVYYKPAPSDDDPAPTADRITEVPIWVLEVRERARTDTEADKSSLLLEWISPDGRTKRAVLYQSDVHELRTFRAWLSDHNLISAVKEVKLLVAYIGQYTLKLLKQNGAREYHEALGWYEQGFVVGDRIITAAGAQKALVQSSSPIRKVGSKGTLEGWKAGTQCLSDPRYTNHAFALLCGFGSPILHLVDAQSAVVSLVGQSGAGKTVSARIALSIFGDPDHMSQGASATTNAIEQQLVSNRHAPYLLDEVTEKPVHALTEFVYTAANGQGKASLQRNREMREAGTWQLVPFVTSNLPLLEFNQKDVQEAHRRRILELTFYDGMPGADGKALDEAARHHHGTAAEPYLQQLVKMRAQVPALFEQACDTLSKDFAIADANRFGLWTAAAALVGGAIAKAAGLISFDPMTVVRRALGELEQSVEETRTEEQRLADALSEFLAEHSRQVCRWSNGHNDLGELVDDPVARDLGNGLVAVHRRLYNELLHEQRISKSAIKAWVSENVVDTKTTRLAPGTPGVWAHHIKADAVGFTSTGDD